LTATDSSHPALTAAAAVECTCLPAYNRLSTCHPNNALLIGRDFLFTTVHNPETASGSPSTLPPHAIRPGSSSSSSPSLRYQGFRMPSSSPWSALPANSVSSILGPETFLVKYPSSSFPGPIPFAARDFAVIEDVRDLMPSHPINTPRKLRLRIIPSWIPGYPPDFLLVCRDDNLSSCRWYGIRLHRSVLWRNGGKGIRGSLGEAPTVRSIRPRSNSAIVVPSNLFALLSRIVN
jgi:hypothetical protein